MFFKTFGSKTVKELRKNQGMTVVELARESNLSSSMLKKVDHFELKKVPEPIKSRIEPILRGLY